MVLGCGLGPYSFIGELNDPELVEGPFQL
jgi:hypothetical protein